MPKRLLPLGLTLTLLLTVLAQDEAAERVITITYSGGNRSAPDLRYGPYSYTHPDPLGIVATVSNLTIYAPEAELRAPEGVLIAEAEGERQANFGGGVQVERGRLSAAGPDLSYSEATGLGVLTGSVSITVSPREEGNDPVQISAEQAEFDVDTDTSVSSGGVQLLNGNQSAESEQLVFEEERNLAKLTSEGQQVVMRRVQDDGDELVITADVGRALTESDKLLATGNVTVIDGDIVSTGDTVYYDDETSTALVIGNPARSENRADGTVTTGGTLLQRTDIDAVRLYSDALDFEEADFLLTGEQN